MVYNVLNSITSTFTFLIIDPFTIKLSLLNRVLRDPKARIMNFYSNLLLLLRSRMKFIAWNKNSDNLSGIYVTSKSLRTGCQFKTSLRSNYDSWAHDIPEYSRKRNTEFPFQLDIVDYFYRLVFILLVENNTTHYFLIL